MCRFIALCKLVRDQAEEKNISKQSEVVLKDLSLLEFQVGLSLVRSRCPYSCYFGQEAYGTFKWFRHAVTF